jgi:tripartite-type tricarboxylate transporter receptor subunit TctC
LQRHRMGRIAAVAASLTATIGISAGGAAAATVSHQTDLQKGLAFYKGKTLTIIEPGATGAIFDLIARTEATYLGQYLHATVNVEDVTTGNTISGQDDTAGANPDGLTLGLLNLGNDASLALTHTPGLNFNPSRLAFIAASAPSTSLMIASKSSPYTDFKSLVKASSPTVLMENTGTVDVLTSSLLGILGSSPHYVTGYTSIGSYVQGFVRGDGPVMMTNLASTGPLVAGGTARALAVTSVPPVGTLYRQYVSSVPTFAQLEKQFPPKTTKQQKEWAALNAFFGATSTPLVTQTAVPGYKVDALRAAAVWMFKQSSFQSKMLGNGQNPKYVDPVTAKTDYSTVLAQGGILEPFFSRFT